MLPVLLPEALMLVDPQLEVLGIPPPKNYSLAEVTDKSTS